jgi:hypothetical protein
MEESKIKKVLAILLAILFVVSLTAVAASAANGGLGGAGSHTAPAMGPGAMNGHAVVYGSSSGAGSSAGSTV